MTEPFHDRAAEIIAAYGADPARWPDGERATAVHVIAASAVLTAALAEARALDGDLAAWAAAPLRPGDAARAAARVLHRPRPFVRWGVGTALAASLAAGLVLSIPSRSPHLPRAVPAQVAVLPDDATVFSQVFTPTPDEEQLL